MYNLVLILAVIVLLPKAINTIIEFFGGLIYGIVFYQTQRQKQVAAEQPAKPVEMSESDKLQAFIDQHYMK